MKGFRSALACCIRHEVFELPETQQLTAKMQQWVNAALRLRWYKINLAFTNSKKFGNFASRKITSGNGLYLDFDHNWFDCNFLHFDLKSKRPQGQKDEMLFRYFGVGDICSQMFLFRNEITDLVWRLRCSSFVGRERGRGWQGWPAFRSLRQGSTSHFVLARGRVLNLGFLVVLPSTSCDAQLKSIEGLEWIRYKILVPDFVANTEGSLGQPTSKAHSHLLQQCADSEVDCVNVEIVIFLSLCHTTQRLMQLV